MVISSIFVGVVLLSGLRILERQSFPHFSLTCFVILSWHFAYIFVLLNYRSSLSLVNLCQFVWGLCPFWNLEYWKYKVSAHFSYMLWHIELKFCILLCLTALHIKFEFHQFASIFVGVMPLLEIIILKIHSFLHFFFSYMLWHIELKVCILLCFTVLQIKFKCHRFSSIFVGVMLLLGLRILERHSVPHFSLTCFDILSWNFTYDFVLL